MIFLVTPFYGVTRPEALYALTAWKQEMDSAVFRILPLWCFSPKTAFDASHRTTVLRDKNTLNFLLLLHRFTV